MQLHRSHRYFKGDTPGVGAVIGLLSKILYIRMDFENFRGKLKNYVGRKLDNAKDVICVAALVPSSYGYCFPLFSLHFFTHLLQLYQV